MTRIRRGDTIELPCRDECAPRTTTHVYRGRGFYMCVMCGHHRRRTVPS